MMKRQRLGSGLLCASALMIGGAPVQAHIFITAPLRVGAYPPGPGSGWEGEAYLNLPADAAVNLIVAENYITNNGIQPDFTFRTDWIDFPAGPDVHGFDTDFETVGDFLNDYIYDVSDPQALDAPFGHLLLRFHGYMRVSSRETHGNDPRLPVWIEMGSSGHDGFRTRMVDTIYRLPTTQPGSGAFRENAIVLAMGLFPIEVTLLNRYDPTETADWRFAGIEFYSWHEPGKPRPGNVTFEDPVLGYPSLFPPYLVFRESDIQPIVPGDFEADSDVDVGDYAALQDCFSGPGDEEPPLLDLGCESFDFDEDGDVDVDDHAEFVLAQTDPGG